MTSARMGEESGSKNNQNFLTKTMKILGKEGEEGGGEKVKTFSRRHLWKPPKTRARLTHRRRL